MYAHACMCTRAHAYMCGHAGVTHTHTCVCVCVLMDQAQTHTRRCLCDMHACPWMSARWCTHTLAPSSLGAATRKGCPVDACTMLPRSGCGFSVLQIESAGYTAACTNSFNNSFNTASPHTNGFNTKSFNAGLPHRATGHGAQGGSGGAPNERPFPGL